MNTVRSEPASGAIGAVRSEPASGAIGAVRSEPASGASKFDALRADVLSGLNSAPKMLPPKWFYDERGSELFDEITRLPEYYPTRAERAALADHSREIAELTHAETLVELGSGTSEKTRLLLSALSGTLRRFVPFDVDPSVLSDAAAAISVEYPALDVSPVVGDFDRDLGMIPAGERRLIAFLGSTIGNFEPAPRAAFLKSVRSILRPGDAFLLGTDLVKDVDRLVAAYDDSAGVTAAFNRNVLEVVNRELKADFDPSAFEHVAKWNAEAEWIEMWLRSARAQTVNVGALDMAAEFAAGEEMRTEVSAKFRLAGVRNELAAAGLRLQHWWTDPAGDFGLSLSIPV